MAVGLRFPVDASAILSFAASLGETNRIYYDEEYAASTPVGGVVAPPTFTSASSHWNPFHVFKGVRQIPAPDPARQAAREEGRGARGDAGGRDLARVLHGEQRFDYHRPVRPGMVLTAVSRPGRTWEKEGRRGGSMRFSETVTEYRDEQGERVVTATSVGIVTSKAVE